MASAEWRTESGAWRVASGEWAGFQLGPGLLWSTVFLSGTECDTLSTDTCAVLAVKKQNKSNANTKT